MRHLCSWRLSRLLDVSAWKRLKVYHWWILFLIFGVCISIFAYFAQATGDESVSALIGCLAFLTVWQILQTVLGADEFYHVQLKTTVCYIYIYNRYGPHSAWQDIIFIQEDTEAHVETTSTCLREAGYQSTGWESLQAFIYCPEGDNNKWYYLGATSDEAQFLGKKLMAGEDTPLFLAGITKDGKQDLCVLHENGVKHILADNSVIDNAYVPPKAEENISYVQTLKKRKGDVPETYLITENNGTYQVYGLFYILSDYPQCWEVNVPVIIFQDVKDRVVLINENGVYKPFCRKIPATRWINDVIPELTEEYDNRGIIGGIVWKFDEETNTLQKLYEGRYHALGFSDGSIVGDDWEYTPDPDKGKEYEYEVEA